MQQQKEQALQKLLAERAGRELPMLLLVSGLGPPIVKGRQNTHQKISHQ